MSRTFKTAPNWVKLKRFKSANEYHDHRHGICDIAEAEDRNAFYWQHRGYCGYDVPYYGYNNGFYSRPERGQVYRQEFEGKMRANWRKQRHDMLKLNRDDLEDYDYHGQQHRHSALWEIW